MPTISLVLSDAALTEVVDALCTLFKYSATLPNGAANPETRNQFARRMLIEWMKDRVRAHRRALAIAQASGGADPDIT